MDRKRFFSLFSLLIGVIWSSTLVANDAVLTHLANGKLKAKKGEEITFLTDGEHYLTSSNRGKAILKTNIKTGQQDTLFSIYSARECAIKEFDGFILSPDEKHLLLSTNTQRVFRRNASSTFYIYNIKRNLVEKLTDLPAIQYPVFSPDGYMLAYGYQGNIYLKKLSFNTEIAITKDGDPHAVLNGISDWLYEEEFGVSSLLSWSSDSQLIGYVKLNTAKVPTFRMNSYKGSLYPGIDSLKYTKAGEENPIASLHVYDVNSKSTKEISLEMEKDGYIPRIVFAGKGENEKLFALTLNRNQSEMNLIAVQAKSGNTKTIVRERSLSFIEPAQLLSAGFYDQHIVMTSYKSGFNHIYLYTLNGVEVRQVTKGEYDVLSFLGFNPVDNSIYYTSNEGNSTESSLFKIQATGDKKVKLSTSNGYNQAVFSPDFRSYILQYSSDIVPDQYTLYTTFSNKKIRLLEDNSHVAQLSKELSLAGKEFREITLPDKTKLNAWVVKPIGFQEGKRYPTIFFQYSGPMSQEVKNKWDPDLELYFATQGFVTVCVDPRGTGGKGIKFGSESYKQLGRVEAEDLIYTAQFISKQNYVDPNRLGIWGWSYGGFTTLMAMSSSKTGIFKAGVSVAPVTSWRFYDSAYSERYMIRPQENSTGYDYSPLSLAKDLKGKLLLIHGSSDDNVHLQHSMEYAKALIQEGKLFDMMIYPDANHSILGETNRKHLYQTITQYFKKNL